MGQQYITNLDVEEFEILLLNSYFQYLGGICGDKCLSDQNVNFETQIFEGYCQCGKQTFHEDDMFIQNIYCCNRIPCNQSGLNITCINGVTKKWNEKCQNDECPTAKIVSLMTLSSKETCMKINNANCFEPKDIYHSFNKVCDLNLDDETFKSKYCGSIKNEENCNSKYSTGKYQLKQCYRTG